MYGSYAIVHKVFRVSAQGSLIMSSASRCRLDFHHINVEFKWSEVIGAVSLMGSSVVALRASRVRVQAH